MSDRFPRLIASGSRNTAFSDFTTAHSTASAGVFVAMLIDSEDPVTDIDKPWHHLKTRDNWDRPPGATDDQVLFMTTCMETWIVADRGALGRHYGARLQHTALPSTVNLEGRDRGVVHDSLVHATRNCKNFYKKGERSFVMVGELDPATLEALLPSFARMKRILARKL